jgi:hypothetical protein
MHIREATRAGNNFAKPVRDAAAFCKFIVVDHRRSFLDARVSPYLKIKDKMTMPNHL